MDVRVGLWRNWVPKNWCFWTVVLEKTLENPLDCKETQPVHPKGDQFWVFIGRTDVEAETPILWPPDAKSWLIRKDPDAVKDWGQEEKWVTEDEVAGWHHWLSGHELSKLQDTVKDRGAYCTAAHGVTKSQTGLPDWTTYMSSPQILWGQSKGCRLSVGLGRSDWVINGFRMCPCHCDLCLKWILKCLGFIFPIFNTATSDGLTAGPCEDLEIPQGSMKTPQYPLLL